MNLELDNMTDKDKLILINQIWSTIKEPQLIPMPEEHEQILNNREKNSEQNLQDWNAFKDVLNQFI